MARRALLIGSQTFGLSGVHGDVAVMAGALARLGFDVRTLTETNATGTAIRTAYEELIESSGSDDAALVYYSGHGGRWRNRRTDRDRELPEWLQFIVPTDYGRPDSGGFGGILAQELSILQHRLTERTRNVTTILDCCHSARMFRSIDAMPRALTERELPWDDVVARWKTVREAGEVARADANPDAVQLVACAPDQSAYELPSVALGGTHGAMTAALVQVLDRPEAATLSWREVIEVVQLDVLDIVPSQRPDLLGANAARVLFTLTDREFRGVLRVAQVDGDVWLEGASLFGIAEGNTFVLREPGTEHTFADAVVEGVVGDRARLSLDPTPAEALPRGVLAYPVEVSLCRRPVLVAPPDHPDRDVVIGALSRSRMVRVAAPGAAEVIATLTLDDEGILVLDAAGEPLGARHRPVTKGGLALVGESLDTLARATHVRELESGSGAAALPDDVAVAYGRIDPETGEEVPIGSGEHLYVDDALVVGARNLADANRYVSVLDIGLSGAVTILTTAEPSGATVTSGEELVVGQDPAGAVRGIGLFWPEGLPKTGPRPETLITLIADRPVAGLRALEQQALRTRSLPSPPSSGLDMLMANMAAGNRDMRPESGGAGAGGATRYRVERLDFVLHPRGRPTGMHEPPFEVDDRPDPSFRILAPRSLEPPPEHVSVRLVDLTVLSNRRMFRAKVRVDTLVLTSGADDAQMIHARTFVVDRIRDGDKLPLDHALIFDGPVRRFLDIAVWVSKSDQKEVDLADLLAVELGSQEVVGAMTTLAALAVAAPAAAAMAGSVAAVATLVRTGARLLSAYSGTSIGVYRTSLLPHERFGAGRPVQRHPARGTIAAQDLALAYEVIDATSAVEHRWVT